MHFERFPASLKGAFVMRGADGNPHQVRLDEAQAVELAGRGTVPMGIAAVTLEVAPTRDLFVPFEFPVVELPSGWYAVECRIAIDGSPETVRPGSRFAIPWPRGATRRDRVRVGRAVEVAGQKVRLDELECRSDTVELRYDGAEASFTLTADGTRVPVLEATFDEETGAGTVTAYPLLKTQHVLSIAPKGAGDPVEVPLP